VITAIALAITTGLGIGLSVGLACAIATMRSEILVMRAHLGATAK
jgi:hypothetical protein